MDRYTPLMAIVVISTSQVKRIFNAQLKLKKTLKLMQLTFANPCMDRILRRGAFRKVITMKAEVREHRFIELVLVFTSLTGIR